MMLYKEDVKVGNVFRQEYRDGIKDLIEKLTTKSKEIRGEKIKEIIADRENCKKEFVKILGWPLEQNDSKIIPKVNKIFIAKDGDISIYRMQFYVLDIPFYGLLFVREDGKKRPLVIAQHGGQGCPEETANLLESGTANYNNMIERVLKYDVNVFAPQLLLWRQEFSFDEYDGSGYSYEDAMRKGIDNQLKQFGSSITALEIYCIKRTIDYFEEQSFVDAERFGMLGLSYGGFYTLYTAAIEERIKCCLSCAFFNDRIKYNWSDFVWFDSGNKFTDVEVALLVQPRPLYICIADRDKCFEYESGLKTWNELESRLTEDDNIHFISFDGTHEFIKDDIILEQFINDLLK